MKITSLAIKTKDSSVKMTITQIFLGLALILNSVPTMASSFRIWTAIRSGQQIVTSYDLQRHIELTHLSDEARRALFRLSEGDYNRYQQTIAQIAEGEFENALKSVAYAKLIETIATRPLFNAHRREAFTVTNETYHDAVNARESEVLRQWLDQRLGIVVARREYARQLRENHFPHMEHETDDQVYFRWLDEEKYKIKDQLHQREVARYEQARVSRIMPSRLNRPLEIHDLYRDITQTINQELQGKELSAQEVATIRSNHPELAVIIQDIRLLGLQGSSLYRIHQLDQSRFYEALRLLQSEFHPALSETRIERLDHYEKMAGELASRHQDAQKLAALSNVRLLKFTAGGSHNDFMMARLYHLAQLQLENNPDRERIIQRANSLVREGMVWLKQQNQNGTYFLGENFRGLLYEDAVARALRSHLQIDSINDTYEKAYLEMAIWVIKFEAKRVSLQDRATVHVSVLPYQSSQTYRRLEAYINQRDFQNGYQQFLRNEVAREAFRLEVNPTGSHNLRGDQAFEYIRQ
jgi:hypothetical protein